MDMKEFTYLIALAEEGSISKAAQRLYMAQSSLSQFLQQFESELGTKLFVRTSKGIHPTYSGACFIEQTMQIASLNGHLCHIRRTARDIISGQERTH